MGHIETAKAEIKIALNLGNQPLSSNLKFGEHGWDSMNHLKVMLILEQYFSLEITEENIVKFQEMSNIIQFIENQPTGEN